MVGLDPGNGSSVQFEDLVTGTTFANACLESGFNNSCHSTTIELLTAPFALNPGTIQVPFTMTPSFLRVVDLTGNTLLRSTGWQGSGIATLNAVLWPNGNVALSENVTWTFTPEPDSAWLLGGVLGLWTGKRLLGWRQRKADSVHYPLVCPKTPIGG
jgi:hypothetical protein